MFYHNRVFFIYHKNEEHHSPNIRTLQRDETVLIGYSISLKLFPPLLFDSSIYLSGNILSSLIRCFLPNKVTHGFYFAKLFGIGVLLIFWMNLLINLMIGDCLSLWLNFSSSIWSFWLGLDGLTFFLLCFFIMNFWDLCCWLFDLWI